MADEREFRIKITTAADGSGAQKAAAELDNLSPKTQKYIESLRAGGQAADDSEVSHRNMRYGMRMLGREFVETGHFGVAAFANPVTAAFLSVSLLAGKLMADWQKTKEAIESAPDLTGIDRVTKALGWQGMLKAMIEGGMATEEFWGKINRLADAQETLKEKTDDATAALKAQTEADNKVLTAKEKAELAELKLSKTRGDISEDTYNQRKAEIEQRFEGERGNNKAIEQDRVIEARKKERADQAAVAAAGPDVILPKEIAADRAKGELDTQKAQLEEWRKKLEEINKWFTEKGTAALGSGAGRAKYSEMEKTRGVALAEIATREQGGVPEAEVKAKAAAEELADARRKVEEAEKRKTELDREIGRLEAEKSRDDSSRGEEGKANARRRRAESEEATLEQVMKSPGAKSLNEGADLQVIKEHGGRLTVQQNSQLNSVKSLLQSHGMNAEATLHVLATLHNNTQALNTKILAMDKQIQAFGKQIRNQASPP